MGDPSGDASPYGTWNESIPGGAQVFPAPFGGINFPSNPAGCTYGGGSCGGIIFGYTPTGPIIVPFNYGWAIRVLVLVRDFAKEGVERQANAEIFQLQAQQDMFPMYACVANETLPINLKEASKEGTEKGIMHLLKKVSPKLAEGMEKSDPYVTAADTVRAIATCAKEARSGGGVSGSW